jgi:L-asparaginase II
MDEVLVEVLRGGHVESRHLGAAVVVDAAGRVVFAAGDIDEPTYPRSAVKAILALPLVESGAADRLGLTDGEIALACASHSGEPVHVAAAASMLRKAGRDADSLECGTHWPTNAAASRALAASGATATALHNNCSGKHAGFICLACDQGVDPSGYVEPNHPTMRDVTAALADLTSARLGEENRAVDGCSIPTYAIPLRALALAFARFGTGVSLAPARAAAAVRIRAAVAADPLMVSGTGRFDAVLMAALGARVFSKTGAEGVFCASFPAQGLGVAIKARDGATRAAEVTLAALARRFIPEAENHATVNNLADPVLSNWRGLEVGALRAAGRIRDER